MRSGYGTKRNRRVYKARSSLLSRHYGTGRAIVGAESRTRICVESCVPASANFGSKSRRKHTIVFWGSSAKPRHPLCCFALSERTSTRNIAWLAQRLRSGNHVLNTIKPAPESATSNRMAAVGSSLADPEFRAAYMAHHLRAFLADQIRGLRGDMTQKAFGELIGKPQSVVSRLENEDYGKVTLQTLIDIATKLDIAFLGRFVDFPTFLRATGDFSESAVAPQPYRKTTSAAREGIRPKKGYRTRRSAAE